MSAVTDAGKNAGTDHVKDAGGRWLRAGPMSVLWERGELLYLSHGD